MNAHIQRAADAARAAEGLPTYADLARLITALDRWQEVVGGWESPVWEEVHLQALKLAAMPPTVPQKS